MQRICEFCRVTADDANMTIAHEVNCPNHPDAIDDTPQPEPIVPGSNVASLSAARLDKGTAKWPDDCPAMAALDLARDWVRKSGKNPDHVIVFLGKQTEDGADGIKFFQTGTYRSYAQVGMVHAGLEAMNQSGFAGYDE